MPRLQAIFYRAPDGSEPVDDFIESLKPAAEQAAIDNQVDRLNMLTPSNPHLPFPHSLRSAVSCGSCAATTGRSSTASSTGARGNLIILLHMFRKDTGRIPEREIEAAEQRWEDFKARMDAEKRRPPRAAGRDAP